MKISKQLLFLTLSPFLAELLLHSMIFYFSGGINGMVPIPIGTIIFALTFPIIIKEYRESPLTIWRMLRFLFAILSISALSIGYLTFSLLLTPIIPELFVSFGGLALNAFLITLTVKILQLAKISWKSCALIACCHAVINAIASYIPTLARMNLSPDDWLLTVPLSFSLYGFYYPTFSALFLMLFKESTAEPTRALTIRIIALGTLLPPILILSGSLLRHWLSYNGFCAGFLPDGASTTCSFHEFAFTNINAVFYWMFVGYFVVPWIVLGIILLSWPLKGR